MSNNSNLNIGTNLSIMRTYMSADRTMFAGMLNNNRKKMDTLDAQEKMRGERTPWTLQTWNRNMVLVVQTCTKPELGPGWGSDKCGSFHTFHGVNEK